MKYILHNLTAFLKAKSYKLKASDGITIYLAMLMLSTALTTAIFVSTVFVREFTISKEIADSLKAVYAADTAMEYTLYQARVDTTFSSFIVINTDGHVRLPIENCEAAIYNFATTAQKKCVVDAYIHTPKGTTAVPGCPASSSAPDCTRIVTKGSHGTINRAMEIVYENL